jgi:DNA-binding NarL/FixJ family response regulator
MESTGSFLVVEDDQQTSQMLLRLLGRIRPTEVVNSVREARRILAPWKRWTGLVVDVGLPDGSGMDVVTDARQRYPLLPVLVLTGRNDRGVINRSFELRAEFVVKPAEGAELLGFVRRAIAFERVPIDRVAWVIDEVARNYGLTTRESELIAACVSNTPRVRLAEQLGVTDNTLKSQIRSLLRKTGCETLDVLCKRLLNQALGGSEIVSDKSS